jgi:hypothetical protein
LAPVEISLANETEGIGEVVERLAKRLDCQEQFVHCETSLPGFDRGNGLAIFETE